MMEEGATAAASRSRPTPFLTKMHQMMLMGNFADADRHRHPEAYDFEDLESMVEEIARAFKTKIMFIYVDTAEENLAKPFLTLYGLESEKAYWSTAYYITCITLSLVEQWATEKKSMESCKLIFTQAKQYAKEYDAQ
ncbi:hypothetical protein ACJX0J_017554, partial [Zea mays]